MHALLRSVCCGLATLLLRFSRVAKPQSMLPQPHTCHHIGARQVTVSNIYLSTVELTTLSEQQLVYTSHVSPSAACARKCDVATATHVAGHSYCCGCVLQAEAMKASWCC